jgi:membrane protein involved in colicin uptake
MPITRRGNERAIRKFEERNRQLAAKAKKKDDDEKARKARVAAATAAGRKAASDKRLTAEQAKKLKKQNKGQRIKMPKTGKGTFSRGGTGRLGRNTHWSE